jgi:hypothetical protein
MDFSNIKIKYIPALFPSVNFVDNFYQFGRRIVMLPEPELVLIQTEKKYKTLNNTSLSTEQIIQSIKYDRYSVELETFDITSIANIQIADNIVLIDEYDNNYTVKLLEINYEKQSESTIYSVTLTFASLEDDDVIINNYKIGSYVQSKHTTPNNLTLTVSPISPDIATSIVFYTEFQAEQIRGEIELTENKIGSGVTYVVNSTDHLETRIKFILTRAELLVFQKYFYRATALVYNQGGSAFATASTKCEYTINENPALVDIFDIDIVIKNDVIKYYHFA